MGRRGRDTFAASSTVVAKLFEIVRPDCAFFGQKDAAQVAVLRKMVRDLDMDVEVVVCPIVREKDGLAMSSRNVYLSPEQRQQALVLHRALMRVQTMADRGERDAATLVEIGKQVIAEEPAARLDYFAIVDAETLDADCVTSPRRGAGSGCCVLWDDKADRQHSADVKMQLSVVCCRQDKYTHPSKRRSGEAPGSRVCMKIRYARRGSDIRSVPSCRPPFPSAALHVRGL